MSEFDKLAYRIKRWLRPRLEAAGLLASARQIRMLLRPARVVAALVYPSVRLLLATCGLLAATLLVVVQPDRRCARLRRLRQQWRWLGLGGQVLWFLVVGRYRIPRRGSRTDEPLVVMLAVSNLSIDPRVEREARALVAHGFRVKVISPMWSPATALPDWGPGIAIRVLPGEAGSFMHQFPYLLGGQLLQAALEEPAWAYHAHDLSTALTALLAAARRQVPCLCDFHEWFSENVSYDYERKVYRPHPLVKRWIFRELESLALRSATSVITVCAGIAERLSPIRRPRDKVQVIRNIPAFNRASSLAPTDLRVELGIAPAKKIVLYQGGTGPTRNLEPIIRAMPHVEDAVFVIRGPSIEHFEADYLQLAAACGAAGKVFCLPAVPAARVVEEARAADLGIWTLLSNVGLNFELALPNKVFEYLAAGIPLLAADLPEVRKLIRFYEIGLCFDPEDPVSIARCINRLAQDEDLRRRFRANIPVALRDLQADAEWAKFARIYEGLDPARTQQQRTRGARNPRRISA